jgi:hypothetical protein
MFPIPFDFGIWALSVLFGAFCVWNACRIINGLNATAGKELVAGGNGDAANVRVGNWLQVAIKSPAVVFFALGVCSGVVVPALYSWWYSPMGPKGSQIVTVRGQFHPNVANVCFQTDQVVSYASGYAIRLPRQVRSVTYSIQTPNMTTANLFLELDGSGAWYSIDNGPRKPAAVDSEGVLPIGDPIPFEGITQAGPLAEQVPNGTQTSSLKQALTVHQQ